MAAVDSRIQAALLSFDGGGIRGYSSLLILEKIMEAIKRKQGLDRTPAPCEYFSFIGGTSTGGIIAILLGPLRMTVGEALGAYNAVAKDAFTPKRHLRYSTKTGKYSATKLKTATQNILVASDHAHNDREAFYRNPECVKTIVLAVTKEDVSRGPTLFRTYADDAQYAETKIWEVIRATSAAVTFFKPIAVGRDQIEFMDAGFGCNNPCDVLIQECAKASQDQGISCVVSIGTGLGRAVGVTGRRSLLAALAKMATQSQQVHTRLRDQHAADVARIYWRFDEDVAISEIEMDDYKKMPKISSFTSNYLKDDTTKRLIENCADTIIDARNTKENIEPAGNLEGPRTNDQVLRNTHGQLPPRPSSRSKFDLECLRSLSFPQMIWRRLELGDKVSPRICKWAFEHNVFMEWSFSPQGPLWIKGKPGSGKSTLMEVITQKFQALAKKEGSLLLVFFFNAFGREPLVKSTAGMFRSLLHQLIDQDSSSLEKFRLMYQKRKETLQYGEVQADCWHEQEQNQLKGFFTEALEDIAARGKKVIILIDALDEVVHGSAQDVITYLHRLDKNLRQLLPKTRMCFSCRHYPIYTATNRHEIFMERHNDVDIRTFVRTEFAEKGILRLDVLESSGVLAELEKELVRRACGVFLWAFLITPGVVRQLNVATPLPTILASLDQAPTRLGEIYSDIIRNVIHQDMRLDSYKLMKWASRNVEPLPLVSIAVSVHFTPTYAMPLKDFHLSDELQDVLEIRVGNFTGGLLEVKLERGDRAAFFIHPTVKTFLKEEGLRLLHRLQVPSSPHSSTSNLSLNSSHGPDSLKPGPTDTSMSHVGLNTSPTDTSMSRVGLDRSPTNTSMSRVQLNTMGQAAGELLGVVSDNGGTGRAPIDAHETKQSEIHVRSTAQWFEKLSSETRALSKARNAAKERVKIAILDTGIDMSHSVLQASKDRIELSWASFGDEGNEDDWGLGTHAAALLVKIAPECRIYPARIASRSDSDLDPEKVTMAIYWAVGRGVDIICIPFMFDPAKNGLEKVSSAIRHATKKDIIVFAATSTGASIQKLGLPAKMADVIAVYSADPFGNASSFNPPPHRLDENFSFLGEDVESAWPVVRGEGSTKSLSGSSVAAVVAAGLAALILEISRQDARSLPDHLRHYLHSPKGMRIVLRFLSSSRGDYGFVTPFKLLEQRQGHHDIGRFLKRLLRDS